MQVQIYDEDINRLMIIICKRAFRVLCSAMEGGVFCLGYLSKKKCCEGVWSNVINVTRGRGGDCVKFSEKCPLRHGI